MAFPLTEDAMPWTVTDPMLERAKLIALHAEGLYAVAELATRAGVSHKTAYKWIARYREGGAEALADRSHARHEQGVQTPPEVEALLIACREAHPTWGPRKLLPYLGRRHPALDFPAPSTVGAILERHSLTKKRRQRPAHSWPCSSFGAKPLLLRSQ